MSTRRHSDWPKSRAVSTRWRKTSGSSRASACPATSTPTASALRPVASARGGFRAGTPLSRSPNAAPVHDDFPRAARSHDAEGLGVLLHGQVMRDDGLELEAALQQARHFVPGLEHLAAVDAFQRQALEDHLIPVDG